MLAVIYIFYSNDNFLFYIYFFQNVLDRMERIVRLHAINTVSTRRVTDLTVVVCMAVKKRGIA